MHLYRFCGGVALAFQGFIILRHSHQFSMVFATLLLSVANVLWSVAKVLWSVTKVLWLVVKVLFAYVV